MPAPTPSKPPEDRHTITCLYCGKPQEVARRAMSITCRHCHKPLKLEDIAIKQYEARRQIAIEARADAQEFWMALIFVQEVPGARVGEIHPPDHALNEGVLSGQFEQPAGVLRGLHLGDRDGVRTPMQ